MKNAVLSLKNIVKEFPTSKKNKKVHAISNVSLDIKEGAIAFIQSECPDHICERFGYIKNVGESAICLPAQASVTIISE